MSDHGPPSQIAHAGRAPPSQKGRYMPIVTPSAVLAQLAGRTTALCGPCKGCGKSTALIWASGGSHRAGSVAIMSIGSHLHARAAALPSLALHPGDVVLTAQPLAQASPASLEILALVPGRARQGRLVLARAHRTGTVELVGPEFFSVLQETVQLIRAEGWAQTVLIDGAAGRLTQMGALTEAQFLYVMQISPANLPSALEQLHLLDALVNLPLVPASAAVHRLDHPLTEDLVASLPHPCPAVTIADMSQVLLSAPSWQALRRETAVYVERRISLVGVLLVLRDLSRPELEKHLAKTHLPLLFNPLAQDSARYSAS